MGKLIVLGLIIWGIYAFVQRTRQETNGASAQVRTPAAAAVQPIGAGEIGPVVYFANDPHNRADREYRFSFKQIGDSWRIYILRNPSLGGRDSGGGVTHRLDDGSRKYVCWDRPIRSLKDAKTIAKVWADCLQEYIATGKRFG